MKTQNLLLALSLGLTLSAVTANANLPDSEITVDMSNTSLVVIDSLVQHKPCILDDKTSATSLHKTHHSESSDQVLKVQKNGINKVILTGMPTNFCTEPEIQELLDQGLKVAVVTYAKDAEGNDH